MESISMEEILELFAKLGVDAEIEDDGNIGFKRVIRFTVYDIVYRIIWFVNECKLMIGNGTRPAQIPFKYMYYDKTFPLAGEHKSIGFSYVKNKQQSAFDRLYPYEVFRIPLEIKGE